MNHTSSNEQSPESQRFDPGLRLFVSNIQQEKGLFLLALLLACGGALFEGVGLGLLVPFLNSLMDPEAAPLATGLEWFDKWVLAIDQPPLWRLYQICGLILVSIWCRATLYYFSSWMGVEMRERIAHRLRCGIIDQIQEVSLGYFSKKNSGEFLNNLTSQIGRLRHLFDQAVAIVQQGFLLLVYVAALLWISWQLALFAVVFCGLLFLVLSNFLSQLREHGRAIYETDGRIVKIAHEIIGGIRTIASFGTKGFESNRFKEASAESRQSQIDANRRTNLVSPLSQGLASTGLIIMIVVSVQFFVMAGTMSAAALLAFFFALIRLLPLVQSLNTARSQWAISRSAINEIADMLRTDNKPYLSDGPRTLERLTTGFELENVTFGYDESLPPVLKDINLTIEKGKTTALVGGSGAGKTTLADLVARLHDPTSGQILLDGVDLREYSISSLRDNIAIVNQNTFLFNDTVFSNIAYGLEDVPFEDVHWAAEKANAIEFIEDLPNGFSSVLGERGESISGGQRQRLSIARALLRDPEILILDEATSALDSVTESLVQESLEFLMKGRTVIVIAHRLSTIENADRVVVLEQGEIVEEGTYDELLQQKGQFWNYHNMQYQIA